MAKDDDKLEFHSAKEKFPTQDTLFHINSNAQAFESLMSWACPTSISGQLSIPQLETNLAYLRSQPWWRLQAALVWSLGIIPATERLPLCSVPVLSLTTLQTRRR